MTAPKFNSEKLALNYVARHEGKRHVFPIKAGAKFPPCVKDNLGSGATNDPEQIRKLAKQFPGCNWGVALKKSKLFVADIDTNLKKGKVGQQTYDFLDLEYGWPETETVRTPSGGFHKYYNGEHRFALGKYGLGPDIDSPNYVLITGCTFADGTSYVTENDNVPTADKPDWFEVVITAAKKVRVENATEAAIELDKNSQIAWVKDYLINDAEPSIEGKGGESTTFRVACSVKDAGVSYETAVELMMEYYNVEFTCEPLWERDDLAKKIQNAYSYASLSQVGGKSAEAEFGGDDVAEIADSIPTDTAKTLQLNRDKIKRQIRKLLKKTKEAGCTEEEATASLAKARELMTAHDISADDLDKKTKREQLPTSASMDDFWAYLPEHKYLFVPTRKMWPEASVASIFGDHFPNVLDCKKPIHEMAWVPGEETIIRDRIMVEGGWINKPGYNTFNLYIPPPLLPPGDKDDIAPWLDHFKEIFPDDHEHMIRWMAYKVQNPGKKINHGLIVGSKDQGIGKDTVFTVLDYILGEWNVKDVSAAQSMDPKFNPFLQSIVCRINEANDLGDDDKFTFYNRRKTWMTTPPNTLTVTDKNVKAHPVVNVVGVIISTNDLSGLYMPPENRRDYVAWSERKAKEFTPEYFTGIHEWYAKGGTNNVAAYLRSVDLSEFDPKAPPPKTPAFWEIANASQSTEDDLLNDLLDEFNSPMNKDRPVVVTIAQLAAVANDESTGGRYDDLFDLLTDKRQRKSLGHRLAKCGYPGLNNEANATDGRWFVAGHRVPIYGNREVPLKERLDAAAELVRESVVSNADAQRKYREARKAKIKKAPSAARAGAGSPDLL